MKTRIIYKEKIPLNKDNKYSLGRIVEHDSKSLEFGFDTTGLSIIDVTHERYIPIFDQGQVGSCTGNAGIGGISSAPFLNQDNLTYSRDERGALKLYSDNEVLDGYPPYPQTDRGSSGLSCAKNLLKAGVISSYQHTFSSDDALKALSLHPIIVGIHWYSDMFKPDADGRVHPTGTVAGGHEIQAYRVDVENRRIWFHNSWGLTWGVNGDFYLTWEDFATLLAQDGDVVVLINPSITPPTPVVKLSILKVGSRGDDVKKLQTLLGITADGIFGPQTKMAVISFQQSNGLVPDGIVGPMTWGALNGVNPPVDTSKLDKWCNAIAIYEGGKMERNNPGNLEFHGQPYSVLDPISQRFAKFDTYQHGYDALKDLLVRACTGKISAYNPNGTLLDFQNVYSPSSDANNPLQYAQFVANKIGCTVDTIIKTLIE